MPRCVEAPSEATDSNGDSKRGGLGRPAAVGYANGAQVKDAYERP